ncbi:MAG: hypothetical protein IIX45_01665 [Lachnospiraceae bacterium]|nr:hypothetical protein [Lachnospiraceae bacterium]
MKASQIYAKTMKFVWLKLGIGALITGISLVLLAIVVGISLLANSGELLLVLGLIWYILTYGIFRAVMHYMGYLIKAAHIAVVAEAVTTGVIPENMVQVGKDMVKSRFATSNVYIVLDKLVGGAVKQLQKTVGSVGSMLGDIPGIGSIVNILQMFIGIALGYIDECCLGYTFYKKDEKAFKAGCDGVVIYFQNTKHLLKSAVGTTAIVIGLSFVAWLIPFIIFGLIFGAIGVPFAWLFASLIAIIIAVAIKSAFIDSYMMVKTMVSYMSVAPSTQITFDIYDKLCKLSSKFKQLFTKSKEETATM